MQFETPQGNHVLQMLRDCCRRAYLIQNEHLWLSDERSSQSNALPLAT